MRECSPFRIFMQRPISVTIVGWFFIIVGLLSLAYHFNQAKSLNPFPTDLIWMVLVNLLAIVGGVFILRGRQWARWLAIAWITFHVVLSLHSVQKTVVHVLLLVAIAFLLFRRNASAYFRGSGAEQV